MRVLSWCARVVRPAILAAAVLAAVSAAASDNVKGVKPYDPGSETVGIFEGINSGQIEVQLIPKDASRCRLLVTNKSGRPLNIAMPDVLAATPVLAQLGDPLGQGNGRRSGNNGQNNGASQALGFPSMMNNFPGMGFPGGGFPGAGNGRMFNVPNGGLNFNRGWGDNLALFSIPPETVGQLKLPCVCLEHGKPNPRAAIPYQIQPIGKIAARPELAQVLRMLGRGEVDQKAAQAAAWNLNNSMSWKQLAEYRIHHVFGGSEPYFTPRQVAEGKKAVERATGTLSEKRTAPSASVSMK